MADELIQEDMPLEERREQFHSRLADLKKIIEDEINKLSIDSFCDAPDFELATRCTDALINYFDSKFN